MPNLNLLIKPSSSLCNIACSYCFYLDTASCRQVSSYGMMSGSTAEILIQKAFAYAQNSVHFGFQGGEPTLAGLDFYQKFHEKIVRYNTKGLPVSFSLQTNGLLIDEAWAEFFKKHHYLIGLSLDGTKETHDAFRISHEGQPTYTKVLEGIKKLQKAGVDFNILTVVTKLLAHKGRETYLAFQEQEFRYLQFIPCIEPFEGGGAFSLSAEDYFSFLCSIFPLYKEGIFSGNYTSVRYFDNLVGAFLGRPYESCDMQGHCLVNPVIEADGSVYPCDFYVLDEHCLGNIQKQNFEELLNSEAGRQFCAPSFLLPQKCKECPYLSLCRGGGCRRNRLGSGQLPRFCETYYSFFQKYLNDLKQTARFISEGGCIEIK